MQINLLKFNLLVLLGATLLASTAAAQRYFDHPAVIQTSFSREMIGKLKGDPALHGYCKCSQDPVPDAASVIQELPGSHPSPGASFVAPHGGAVDYSGFPVDCGGMGGGCGSGCCDSGFGDCGGCDAGCCGMETGFDCCGPRWGISISGIVDVPLDGVFHTGDDAQVTAGALGVPPAVLAPATPLDLLINEQGFEDIYNTFGGFEANLTRQIDCNTSMFFGYRLLSGRADPVTVGTATANPITAPVPYDINAQFSNFSESTLQAGFLNAQCLPRGRMEFLWGGRTGIAFVDPITATFDIPGVATLTEVPFYDNSTIMNFAFNFGFRRQLSCNLTFHALTGIQYRTSLNEDDSQLSALGLDELNNGSGFASLPVMFGGTYWR